MNTNKLEEITMTQITGHWVKYVCLTTTSYRLCISTADCSGLPCEIIKSIYLISEKMGMCTSTILISNLINQN